jgi:AdoMet-dependent heme synthase
MRIRGGNLVSLGTGVLLHHLAGRTRPLSATLAITSRCNFTCRYCRCSRRDIAEMTTAQALDLIDALKRLGTVKIGFTGGEPLVRRDIFELVDRCRRNGMVSHLVTNASLLDESNVAGLKGLDALMVSYEGPADVNRWIRTGTKDDVEDKIRLAVAAGIKVYAMTTLVRQNLAHVPFIVQRAAQLGVPVLFSLLHEQEYAADDLTGLTPDPGELRAALEGIVRLKRQGSRIANSFQFLEFAKGTAPSRAPRCYAGRLQIVIDSNGDVYPCWPAVGRVTPPNVFRDGFDAAIRRPPVFECQGCDFSCHQELNFLLSLRPEAVLNVLRH